MRTSKVIRIEQGFEIWGLYIDSKLIRTWKVKAFGLTMGGYTS